MPQKATDTGAIRPTILHVSTVHSPDDIRIFQRELISLKEAGYNVSFAAPVDKAQLVHGIPFIPLGREHASRWLRILKNMRALRIMLGPYDVVHIHDPELLIAAYIASFFGKSIVYDIHEYYVSALQEKNWIPKPLRAFVAATYKRIEHLVLRRVSGTVLAHIPMAEQYRDPVRPGRCIVLENYPSISPAMRAAARLAPAPLDEPYIIHTGDASKLRVFHIVVAAIEILRRLGSRAPLINFGNVDLSGYASADQKELLERARRVDIRLMEPLPFGELLPWVAHARVGYVPLAPIARYMAVNPTKLLEYLALGLPSVVAAGPRVYDIEKNWSAMLLVEPLDADQHARAMFRLLSDQALWLQMAGAALAASQHYSWDSMFPNLCNLYDSIGAERSG